MRTEKVALGVRSGYFCARNATVSLSKQYWVTKRLPSQEPLCPTSILYIKMQSTQ